MAEPAKTRRGRLTEVRERHYSEPIPEEFLALFEDADVIVDDEDNSVALYLVRPDQYAFVWGLAADSNDWFVRWGLDGGPSLRVPSRDDGLREVLRSLGSDRCPLCGSDLRAGEIPAEHLRLLDGAPNPPRYYSRMIVVVIPGVYDGGLFYTCPDCSGRWHRWPVGHRLRAVADPYVQAVP